MNAAQRENWSTESAHAVMARQFALITAKQARAVGISAQAVARRIASGEWTRVLPRVYRLTAAEVSLRQWALAPVLWAGDGALASHTTAAALEGFTGVRSPRLAEIWVPARCKIRSDAVRVHRGTRLDRADRTTLDGIPVTTPIRTLIDISGRLEDPKLSSLLEDLLRRGVITEARLRARLAALRSSGRTGAGRLAALLDARGDGRPLESELEALVWQIIVSTGVRLPERQYWITGAHQRYRLDFAWPDLKLGLECEGFEHHGGHVEWHNDRTRYAELADLRWRVIPVTWHAATRERDRVVGWIRNSVPRAA
jgi:very-short-patch-repair endonuclease